MGSALIPAVILSGFYSNAGSDWGALLVEEHMEPVLWSHDNYKSLCVCAFCFPDLLAVPKHPYAAMENWGLSVFVEQKILLDAEVSSSSYQMELTMVVVHEICHQVGTFNSLN